MSKLAIIFPDVNYNADQPLFYYSRKVLERRGYDVLTLQQETKSDQGYTELFKSNPNSTSPEFTEKVFSAVAQTQKNEKSGSNHEND